jgi:hypothetical protein
MTFKLANLRARVTALPVGLRRDTFSTFYAFSPAQWPKPVGLIWLLFEESARSHSMD